MNNNQTVGTLQRVTALKEGRNMINLPWWLRACVQILVDFGNIFNIVKAQFAICKIGVMIPISHSF